MNYEDVKSAVLDISTNKHHYLLSLQNVVGIGFGTRFINGINTFEPCIHVLVKNKIGSTNISSINKIPKTYMGIKTDVIETGEFYARGLTDRVRPIRGGYSVSVDGEKEYTGTVGCIVVRKTITGKKYFILSNNHVLAGNNKFKINSKVVQPASEDGGAYPKDFIGVLNDYVPIKFKSVISSPSNYMDAAIAELSDKSLISNLVGKDVVIKGVADPIENKKIKMVGSTTGFTQGVIVTTGATTKEVIYPDGKRAFFKNQVLAALRNGGGDSGAVILNELNQVVGLLFAGTDSKTALFTNIKLVLSSLKLDIYY